MVRVTRFIYTSTRAFLMRYIRISAQQPRHNNIHVGSCLCFIMDNTDEYAIKFKSKFKSFIL